MYKKANHIVKLSTLLKNEREVNHSIRVANYGWKFSFTINMPYKKRLLLYYLSLYHDIGKGMIDNRILDKNGPLNGAESEIIRMHPLYSEQIVSSMKELSDNAYITRAHHERWDGRGYPDGLLESNIPFLSRVISIIDVYDALTSERSYREKVYSNQEALNIIEDGSGAQFDPKLTKIFIKNFNIIVNSYKQLKGAILFD